VASGSTQKRRCSQLGRSRSSRRKTLSSRHLDSRRARLCCLFGVSILPLAPADRIRPSLCARCLGIAIEPVSLTAWRIVERSTYRHRRVDHSATLSYTYSSLTPSGTYILVHTTFPIGGHPSGSAERGKGRADLPISRFHSLASIVIPTMESTVSEPYLRSVQKHTLEEKAMPVLGTELSEVPHPFTFFFRFSAISTRMATSR